MTAAILSQSQDNRAGLRSVDPGRDMRAIAVLIEVAFSGRLDADSQRMLQWMRFLGRAGRVGWFLGAYLLPPAGRPLGFVWEEDGRMVGNASVLPIEGCPGRWVLVNVAVHPDYQRKGIARALTQASVDLVRERLGKEILLQVDLDNHGALDLYTSLGFSKITTRTMWVRPVGVTLDADVDTGEARRRQHGEWQKQWALAQRLHPEGLIWPYPPTASIYRPRKLADAFFVGGGGHWVWPKGDQLAASLTARWDSTRNQWRLVLVVDHEARDQVEKALIAFGLNELSLIRREIVLDYPSGVAEVPLRELGFIPRRTLVWMTQVLDRS